MVCLASHDYAPHVASETAHEARLEYQIILNFFSLPNFIQEHWGVCFIYTVWYIGIERETENEKVPLTIVFLVWIHSWCLAIVFFFFIQEQ